MQKELKITTLSSHNSDKDYWNTKSYVERLEAIEFLRNQYINFTHANKRLQRICRITYKIQS